MGDSFSNITNSTVINRELTPQQIREAKALAKVSSGTRPIEPIRAAAMRMARLHNSPNERDDTVWSSLSRTVRARWLADAVDVLDAAYPMCPTEGCVLRAGHPGACDIR